MTNGALPVPPAGFRVIVLTCSDLGWETASELLGMEGISVVAVVSAPLRTPALTARLRRLRKRYGTAGMLLELSAKLVSRLAAFGEPPLEQPRRLRPQGVQELRFADLHGEDCLTAIRQLQVDLAIVDGTYILKPDLFSIPRLGAVNLHCGKLPEFRGSPPAFWELMNGENEVGVSVHKVTERLDDGPIYNEARVALDLAPPGDPMRFVHTYWMNTLRGVGRQLIAKTVREIAEGRAVASPQRPFAGSPNRSPDAAAVREVRRRVALRRAERG
ncbi:MAG: hypothetical protein IPP90_01215 [Gemmatimonadaceae bacterium]|nr:hypothetical protein [Gemmatimonadaceae bacterium]